MRCLTLDTNSKSIATGQQQNFNFNSMRKFGSSIIATNEEGLFVIGGDTDAGVNIDGWISTGMTDLGIQANKRLRYIYLGLETDGDLEIDIIADEDTTRTYTIEAGKVNQQRIRLPAGRDIKGVYWSFVIRNKQGVSFSLDSMKILPVVLHHGHL
jgi:hypothetical protein